MSDFKKFMIAGEVLLKPHDKDYFRIAEDFEVKAFCDAGVLTIPVKKNLYTDLGSIPRWVQSLTGIHSRGNEAMTVAFVLHDMLFSTQGHLHDFSFEFVNDLLSDQMEHTNVDLGSIKQYLVNTGVSLGGSKAWNTFDEYDYKNIATQTKPKWGLR